MSRFPSELFPAYSIFRQLRALCGESSAHKRNEIDEKYDYRYSVLILVFARLIKDGWLSFEDLEGLAEEKIAQIGSIGFMKADLYKLVVGD